MWFDQEVKPRLSGRASLVRYADDAVLLFQNEDDARRVMAVLSKRFEKYGLTLHPDKTRLLPFKKPSPAPPRNDDDDPPNGPATFDFLGFTILWAKSLTGKWVVMERTAKDRFCRTLKRLSEWCKQHRHLPLKVQQKTLGQKLRGHYGYFGRRGNRRQLWAILTRAQQIWRRALSRRSQRGLSWEKMKRILERYPLAAPPKLSRS